MELLQTSDLADLREGLRREVGREVVVAGGDGSLHAVVGLLRELGTLASTTLALVPTGTGNDFARGLGLSLDSDCLEAATVVLQGCRQAIDILVDDDDGIVVNAVHVGVGAEAGKEAKPWKSWLGKVAYPVGAAIATVKTRGHLLRVEADGAELAPGSKTRSSSGDRKQFLRRRRSRTPSRGRPERRPGRSVGVVRGATVDPTALRDRS